MFLTFLFLILGNYSVAGQGDVYDPSNPKRGVVPGSSYSMAGVENINLTSGNVMLNMPLAVLPPGRGGMSGSIGLSYNSKLYDTSVEQLLDQNNQISNQNVVVPSPSGGWRLVNSLDYTFLVTSRFQSSPPVECDTSDYDYSKNGFIWKVQIIFPDGNKKEFRPVGHDDYFQDGYYNVSANGWESWATRDTVGGNPTTYVCSMGIRPLTTSPMVYYSTDGSFLRLVVEHDSNPNNTSGANNPWTLYFPDGSYYQSSTKRLTDRYGNFIQKITFTHNNQSATGIEDAIGRRIFSTEGATSSETDVFMTGFGNAELKWTVKWKGVYVKREYETTGNADVRERGGTSTQIGDFHFDRFVDELILPNQLGSLKYTFGYNGSDVPIPQNEESEGWGELNLIELPSGALSEFEYKWDEGTIFTPKTHEVLGNSIKKKRLTYAIEYDGSAPVPVTDEWIYSISRYGSSVTGPDGATMTQLHGDTARDTADNGLVFWIENSNGVRIDKLWANNVPVHGGPVQTNSFVKAELTSIKNASGVNTLTAIKVFTQDKNGNTTSIAEYGFIPYDAVERDGSGIVTGLPTNLDPPIRTTYTSYYNPTPDSSDVTSDDPEAYWNFSNVKGVVAATEIQNSSNTPVARSEFFYDNYSTTANPTETKVWDSFKGGQYRAYSNPLTATNSISTFAVYDPHGNVTQTTDANGTVTQITYGDVAGPNGNVTGLYPTQTIAAHGTPLARTSTAVYDFYTGLPTSTTDLDNGVTNATEYDALGRPIIAKTAVGTALEAWTQTTYNDVDRYIVVRSDLETKEDGRKVAVQHFDQLGRVRLSRSIENIATEDPTNEQHGIKVQTRYKTVNGFTYQLTSNPYRANYSNNETDPTMGWTLATAWSNGKRSEIQTFSGAGLPLAFGGTNENSTGIVRTDIDANRTLVTDQAGKRRISKTNALGQLEEVWEVLGANEPGSESVAFPNTTVAHGFRTAYGYDTLNNLTTVSQGVQTRTFGYSSLSRLLSAANPESGTISYQYDDGGNLTRKTDARGVRTDYVYDALNRVTNRNYSTPGGTPPNYQVTPNVTYTYDDPAVPNSRGRLTKVSSSISTTEYTEFDILGRVKAHKQTTDGQDYTTGYVYNLSGALIEQTYPSGRKVKSTLDADGNLAQVHSRKSSTDIWRPYASNFVYTAAGAVSSLKLGNGRFENTAFNSRLQPTQIGLGSSAANQGLLKLNYDYGTTSNNGNVLSQTITVPTVGQTPGFTAVQSYTYDSLNRLKSATENIDANPTPSWQQTYTFDRYGNRNFDEANTTTMPKECTESGNPVVCEAIRPIVNPSANAGDNRLNGYTFDPAGNTTVDADGRQFTYDAENKQVKVKDPQNQTIGEYFYNGDGLRIKKVVPGTGETTIFVYDASNKLVAEYSTVIEPTATAKTSYLTTDHLGSPRVTTDQFGQVASRRDFMPYGEEIARQNYGADSIRQKFTGYERDGETELNYARARMQNPILGRFSSPDPLYFQATMVFDPQLFNLYVYVKNNPVRLIDPTGESVRVRGQNTITAFQEMAGGEEEFDRYFIQDGDYILMRDGIDLSDANEGVRFLAGLIAAPEMYFFYHGNDFEEIDDLFDGALNDKGKLTRYGQQLKRKFEGRTRGQQPHIGSLVAVYGKPGGIQPGSMNGTPLFAIIAFNSDIPVIQVGIGMGNSRNRMLESFSDGGGIIARTAQSSGIGQQVSAASFFIHEGAEIQTYKRIGFVDFQGKPSYQRAHSEAMRIEARIRESIELAGGFSGGAVARGQ